ncbi:MAG: HAD family phosphatase [Lactimicrobium sp.]|jgi:HAD superfamily hydrolase (TIGR01509 family)|uniref:HAD family hydrolase n=1 Tax=Lactimicrobium sp. TaxID=2563780 RepID=UPI002F35C16E
MKKLVIFDVDGLLLNTEFIWQKIWNEVGEKDNVPAFGPLFHLAVGTNGDMVMNMLHKQLPDLSAAEINKLRDDVFALGDVQMDRDLALMPGAQELLTYLKDRNIPMAVGTATSRIKTKERFERMNLFPYFSCIVCGDEVKKRKPDPEVYQTLLARTKTAPEDVLVLEDTCYGVEAAHRAGIDVIMVPSINPATEIDKSRAYAVVNSLYDVLKMMEEGQIALMPASFSGGSAL